MSKRHASSPTPSLLSPSIASPKKPRSSEFLMGIRDLNTAFLSSIQGALSKDPTCILVPVVKDYLEHTQTLMQKSYGGAALPPRPSSSVSMMKLGEFFDEFEQNFAGDLRVETAEDDNNNKKVIPQKMPAPKVVPTSIMSSAPSSSLVSTRPPTLPQVSEEEEPSRLKLKGVPSVEAAVPSNFMGFPNTPRAPPPTPNTPILGGSSVAFNFGGSSIPSFGTSTTGVSPSGNPIVHSSFPVAVAEPKRTTEEEEEDEEPPKTELVRVTENDAVYSIRCKVFGMIDNQYKDKGVGTLYVKMVTEGKYQVVVRADNNLGTLILNILLNKSLPLEKKSGKDVMTVDLLGNKGKPMPILLRVKSEEDANQLLNQLKEFQKHSSN